MGRRGPALSPPLSLLLRLSPSPSLSLPRAQKKKREKRGKRRYGALSTSWDEESDGSLLGFDELQTNLGRVWEGLRRSGDDADTRDMIESRARGAGRDDFMVNRDERRRRDANR